jgi:hypothetical protein
MASRRMAICSGGYSGSRFSDRLDSSRNARKARWEQNFSEDNSMKSLKLTFRTNDIRKIRNFAEDLSLHLKDLGTLSMADADAAVNTVTVTGIHARLLRRCRVHVERFLDKHFLRDICDIVEQDGTAR